MKRAAIIACAALAACGPQRAPGERAQSVPADFQPRSGSITLPDGGAQLPPVAAALTENCTGCHSAEMILTQPPLDAKKWQAEIDKMRKVFKAPIAESDDPRLIAALTALETQRPR